MLAVDQHAVAAVACRERVGNGWPPAVVDVHEVLAREASQSVVRTNSEIASGGADRLAARRLAHGEALQDPPVELAFQLRQTAEPSAAASLRTDLGCVQRGGDPVRLSSDRHSNPGVSLQAKLY